MENAKSLLRIDQVCDRLQLSRATVYRLLASGDLRNVKVGTARRVTSSDLDSYIEQLRSDQYHPESEPLDGPGR